jgi:DNA polymerase-1
MAMIEINKELSQKGLKTKMIMQVHDELVFEVPEFELNEVKTLVQKSMELNQPLKVPLVVDINYGSSWKE